MFYLCYIYLACSCVVSTPFGNVCISLNRIVIVSIGSGDRCFFYVLAHVNYNESRR